MFDLFETRRLKYAYMYELNSNAYYYFIEQEIKVVQPEKKVILTSKRIGGILTFVEMKKSHQNSIMYLNITRMVATNLQ